MVIFVQPHRLPVKGLPVKLKEAVKFGRIADHILIIQEVVDDGDSFVGGNNLLKKIVNETKCTFTSGRTAS
ncbi:hypothetical protein DOZ58_01975 [Acetobacterium sp. KB-1]|jgi:hypothetical protein|nr:hypothetical protein DOZ58_01975 [Acetobacterium sp. KB-1]